MKNNQIDEFIPENFDEAVDFLAKEFKKINASPSQPGWHHSGGMNLRNGWGLWGNSTPIAKWFTEHQLYHGDDRSGILADAVKAKLNGLDFDVFERIQYYQNWWLNTYGEKCSLENMKKDFFESLK